MSVNLPCIVEYVTFRKDNGFAVLAANLDQYSHHYRPEMEEMVKDMINTKYNSFTVVLGMLDVNEDPKGGQYIFVGNFDNDPKRGKQFKADFYYRDIPNTEDGLRSFLMTLPHIKESRSQAIINRFGVEGTVDVMQNHPERLIEINGITETRIPLIKKQWDEKSYLCNLYQWLSSRGVAVGIADKAYRLWGKKTIEILDKNPYRLVELRGIGFITADKMAHQILKNIPQDYRINACMQYVLQEEVMDESNLCIPYTILRQKVSKLLSECDDALGKDGSDTKSYLETVASILKSNFKDFAVVKDTDESSPITYVYSRDVWDKEKFISEQLTKKINDDSDSCTDEDIEWAEMGLSNNDIKIKMDESQKEAVKSAFSRAITVITGPAGSGKTLICKCICNIAQRKHLSIRLLTPTGKAAQVLGEKTGFPASTIHRALGMKPGDDVPDESITENIIVVDEVSMCGIDTMYAIMSALQQNFYAHIVFVGDKNQLPSVSPGNFLSDMIDSNVANVITLEKIHRQDENSFISVVANEIAKGKVTDIPPHANDIKWYNLDVNDFDKMVSDHVDKYLSSGKDIEDLQIISPMKKGVCGVYGLNKLMQNKMIKINGNENKFVEMGFSKFYLGDRVMQIVNNYEKSIFNGDMGVVIDLGDKVINKEETDKKQRYIVVDFYGSKITYVGKEMEELQLAWCCTVHKMQGSQFPYVMMILAGEQNVMMSKELLYTSITRAMKHVDVFGHSNMWRLCPTKSVIRKRYTLTTKIIKEIKEKKKVLYVLGEKV